MTDRRHWIRARNARPYIAFPKQMDGGTLAPQGTSNPNVAAAVYYWAEYRNGEKVLELDMDFEGLTGRDMEAIDVEIGAMGLRGTLPAYSRKYQRMLAAKAAKVPNDVIEHLPLADYNAVVNAAQNFLFVTG